MLIKFYFNITTAIVLLIVIQGCTKQLTYDDLISDLPAITNNHSHTRSTMHYLVSFPKELKFRDKQYDDTLYYELFIDSTIPFLKGSNIVSVLRILSDERSPRAVYQKLFSHKLISEHYTIHSTGETSFLKYPSYYAHCTNIISNQTRETIIFIVRGKRSDYYVIDLETNSNENYPNNMKRLLSSVKSFNILPEGLSN